MMSLAPAETRNAGAPWGFIFTVTCPSIMSVFTRVRENSGSCAVRNWSSRPRAELVSTQNWCFFASMARLICWGLSD